MTDAGSPRPLRSPSGTGVESLHADAVVVGAGAAGLAAALSLARRPCTVILLEARDRVGGRVLSQPVPGMTTPAELGAEFIHGPASYTMRLLRGASVATVDTGAGDAWVSHNGGRIQRNGSDFTLAAQAFESARMLDHDESADHFLRRLESDDATRAMAVAARAFVEGFEAADPAIASVQSIAQELRSGVDSQSARPVGGYHPMFESLRNQVVASGVQIRQSTAVRRIAWRRGGVDLDVERLDADRHEGKLQTIRARIAIVTLPIGILRRTGQDAELSFDPQLPSSKRAALAAIEMGQAVKVTLWFRSAFWETLHGGRYRDGAYFRCPDQRFAVYWTQFPLRSRLIVAWAGGPKAMALAGASQAELIEHALDGFGALFGEPGLARAQFEGGAAHDWARDPFARGAYSYVRTWGGNARALLAEPLEGSLFFAGEATSSDGQGGTVNGALETGERAAAEAAASLGLNG